MASSSPHGAGPRHRMAEAREEARREIGQQESTQRLRCIATGLCSILLTTFCAAVLISIGLGYEHVHLSLLGTWMIVLGAGGTISVSVHFGAARAIRDSRRD